TVADEGNWQVSCVPSGDYESQLQYVFAVKGAVDERDETQPVLVSVTRKDGTDKVIADAIPGRGAISGKYGIFLGFHAGALTAETPAFEQDPPSYRGVLTLAEDERAAALDVTCVATKSS